MGVGLALLVGGFAFYGALTFAVDRTLDAGALAAADEVAALVRAGRLPSPVPVSGAQVVQVVDAQQRVVAGSATADRLTPLLRPAELARALAGEAVQVPGARAALSVPLRVRAVPAEGPDGTVSVLVALPVGDVLAVRAALRTGLLTLFPLVLLALSAVAWRVVGSTLAPVEQLRAQAERISGTGRTGRLTEPPGPGRGARPWPSPSTRCSTGWPPAGPGSGPSSPTRPTSCAAPSPASAPSSRWPSGWARAAGLPADLLVDVDRLSRLVEDLLLLARADADTRGPARTVGVDVAGLLAQVAGRTPARVPVTVPPGPSATVLADPDELRRVVQNLLDNAVRHASSAVELAVAVGDGRVRLLVRDDGPGVPPEERERVFERFTRRDDARSRDVGGSGLGLPIARELTARAGGTLRLEDAPAPWTLQAVVELPAAPTA